MAAEGDQDGGAAGRPRRNWNALAALLAALIGFLALLVSAYTAYVQRQQVRAQVWPHIELAWSDTRQALLAINKGVGPAIVRSVQVQVGGHARKDWRQVLASLGVPVDSTDFHQSTLDGSVLAPDETLVVLQIPDRAQYLRFATPARRRMRIDACFCSTLGDCWHTGLGDHHDAGARVRVAASGMCPALPAADQFND